LTIHSNVWPFYVYHLFAPNPLIVYLAAVTLTVFGFNFVALCAASAISVALASPAAYLAVRELFADHGRRFARRPEQLAPSFRTGSASGVIL
jgi:4-amino-4-deoxy-L-arabinose transferase-like glycosyltransferase